MTSDAGVGLVLQELARELEGVSPAESQTRGVRSSVPLARYREGFIDANTFTIELQLLGYPDGQINTFLASAVLDFDTNLKSDLLGAYRQGFRNERTTEAEFRVQLSHLGLRKDLVDVYVIQELSRQKLEPPTDEEKELKATGSGTVLRRLRLGFIEARQFQEEMSTLGYTEREIARYHGVGLLEADTNLRSELVDVNITAYRTDRIDAAQLTVRLQELGISPDLVATKVQQETNRRKLESPSEEEKELKSIGQGTAQGRFREGWTDSETFGLEMLSLGYTEREIARYGQLATLAFDFDYKQDLLVFFRDALGRGELEPQEFVDRLSTLGMDPERARVHLARELVRRLPRVRVRPPVAPQPAYLTPSGKVQLRQVMEEFRSDIVERPVLEQRLRDLGMPEELALATVDLEEFRRIRPDLAPPPPEPPLFETAQGKLRLDTLRRLFRTSTIGAEVLYTGLLDLELPAELADAMAENELARAFEPPLPEPPAPPPFYQTPEGRVRVRTAIEAFRRQLIDTPEAIELLRDRQRVREIPSVLRATELFQLLRDLEEPVSLAEATVDFELVRRAPRPSTASPIS